MKRLLGFTILSVFCSIFLSIPVYAAGQSVDFASVYPITDSQAIDGDILVYNKNGLERANLPFSNNIFGVLQSSSLPILIFTPPDTTDKPVSRTGVAQVNVININTQIKKGDYITTSSIPGKGQKATQSGFVLGVAMRDMQNGSDKIPVAIRIEYAELSNPRSVLRLLDYFNLAVFQGVQNPEKSLQFIKYLAAGLVVIVSFILSFLIFSRSIAKSIEAIGRNPLAKSSIQVSLAINAVLTIVTILVGGIAAYIIIRF